MNFETSHQQWYKTLPLKHRIFEMIFAWYVKRFCSTLRTTGEVVVFENTHQIAYWSKHFELYFQALKQDFDSKRIWYRKNPV